MRLARQAWQVPGGIAGWVTRMCGNFLTGALTESGDLVGAERVGAAAVAGARDAGDQESLAELLIRMAERDLRAGRFQDCAAHLRKWSRSSCGPASLARFPVRWTAADTCVPRPAARPRPSRSGPGRPRSSGTSGDSRSRPLRSVAGRKLRPRPDERSDLPWRGRPGNAVRP